MNYHDNEMYNSQNLSKYMNLIDRTSCPNCSNLFYKMCEVLIWTSCIFFYKKIPEDIAKMQNSIDKDCSNIFVRI